MWQQHADLKSVILIGRVAVPYSGHQGSDGHSNHIGAWPADMFYGTLSASDDPWLAVSNDDNEATINTTFPENSNYKGDGKFDADYVFEMSEGIVVNVAVGRIDFAGMSYFTGSTVVGANPTEQEINALRGYFVKNHEFRTGQWNVKRQALIDGEFAKEGGTLGRFRTELSGNVGAYNIRPE